MTFDRRLAADAAAAILRRGGWCVLEVCVDPRDQVWEPRVLIFHHVVDAVVEAIAREVAHEPGLDARLTGCHRTTLCPDPALGAHVCYLADAPEALPAA